MADEFELKLRVPPGRLAAVDAEVAGRAGTPRLGLAASYWDTPGRALSAARLALRVRREGRRRVQTLKGAGADALTRLEHDVPATGDAPDPALHDGTPAGERLRAALATAPGEALVLQFETSVKRRTRTVRTRIGSVELAFDHGHIAAGGRSVPVRELEIELKQGSPAAVFAVARRWIARHGLWIDLRSKAVIGGRLARGDDDAPAVRAQPLRLDAATAPDAALRAMVRNALEQVLANAAELADGRGAPEHLHQCRIGLRRLRTALREFGAFSAEVSPDWEPALAGLFDDLGTRRDLDALAAGLWPELHAAGGPSLERLPAPPADDLAARLRGVPFNLLMLDLMAFAHGRSPAPPPGEPTLVTAVAERLRRLNKRVRADAPGFAALDAPAQHRVRKRLKRLRYAFEFAADLFPRRAGKRYLRELRPAQEALGTLNDLAVAQVLLEACTPADREVWFGLGWLAARREAAALACCEAGLRGLVKVRRPWSARRRARP